MQANIYLKGIDQVEKELNKINKALFTGETKIFLEAAQKIRDKIRENAPMGPPTDKKPGSLKAAAYAIAYPPTTSRGVVAYAGIRPMKAPHAHLVEYGHGGPHPAPPHPFYRPAVDEALPKAKEAIAKRLGQIIVDPLNSYSVGGNDYWAKYEAAHGR